MYQCTFLINATVIYQLKEQVGFNMLVHLLIFSFHANKIYIKDATLTITTDCLTHFMLLNVSTKNKNIKLYSQLVLPSLSLRQHVAL